jgi:hypothetical protein
MTKPDAAKDDLAERVGALRKTVASVLEKPNNGIHALTAELRALSDVLVHAQRWSARASGKNRDPIELTIAQIDGILKALPKIPDRGPELEAAALPLRTNLVSVLVQFALQGVKTIEKDEATLDTLVKKFEDALAAQKSVHESLVAEIQKSLDSARRASESATESARKVGVTVHMTAFSTAASTHAKWAIGWAVCTVLIVTLLFSGAYHSIVDGDGPPVPEGSWHVAANLSHYLARGLAVSLGSFLLVFCTRNFRSAKHNEVINRHRAGALATHDTLRAERGSRVDEAITLHVAEAVFTPQSSGYGDNPAQGTHVTELLNAISSSRQ